MLVTFLYYKLAQVVVTCFCGSGTQVKNMEGKNKFDVAVAVVQSEGSEVASVATFEAGASQCSVQRSIDGTDRTVP